MGENDYAGYGYIYDARFGLDRNQSLSRASREEQVLYQRYLIMREEPLLRERFSLILLRIGRALIRYAVRLQVSRSSGPASQSGLGRHEIRHITI